MRFETQVLTGIALGVALLVGVSGLRRMTRPFPTEAIAQERREPSSLRGDDENQNAATRPDPATVRVLEGPGSDEKSLAAEVDLIEHGSPLDLMVNDFAKPGSDSLLATELLRQHRRIVESSDEPTWSRDTERKLWETIALSQEGPAFEVSSIICRAAGCEVQVFTDSQKAASTWNVLAGKLAQSIPVPVLRSNYVSTSSGGRRMRVLFLVRNTTSHQITDKSSP